MNLNLYRICTHCGLCTIPYISKSKPPLMFLWSRELGRIPDICQFWETAALFSHVKLHPKVSKFAKRNTFWLSLQKKGSSGDGFDKYQQCLVSDKFFASNVTTNSHKMSALIGVNHLLNGSYQVFKYFTP